MMKIVLRQTAIAMMLLGAWAVRSPAQNTSDTFQPSAFHAEKKAGAPTLSLIDVATDKRGDKSAEQLISSLDLGDSYPTAKGPRKLLRLAGAVAVGLEGVDNAQTVVAQLTAANGPLPGYRSTAELGRGIVLLKAPQTERDRQLGSPAALQQVLDRSRGLSGAKFVNPVFVDPDSGLLMVPTEELIVRLNPGVDAKAYFGARINYRPLSGTSDQFIATLPGSTAEQVLADVTLRAGDARVEWAEPDFLMECKLHSTTPNDTYFSSQWHLNNTGQSGGIADADIDGPEAWDTTTGNSGIVAILDVGEQTTHPELNPALAINAGEISGNGIDDDGNGYVDDVNGWDFYGSDNNPDPNTVYDNHGTSCAGVAVARGNNGVGVASSAYSAGLLPIRIGESPDSSGSFYSSTSIQASAIYYAAGRTANGLGTWRGADVLSMSWGSSQSSTVDTALSWAVASGRNGKGASCFVSTGNGAGAYATYSVTGLPAGTWFFEWTYGKDASGSAGSDTCWLAYVQFPDGSVERFNSPGTPPGWNLSPYGGPAWIIEDDPSHAYGTGRYQARAGTTGNSQMADIRSKTVTTSTTANITFRYWISSESAKDGISIYLYRSGYGWYGPFLNASGVPSTTTPIGYPASHVDTIAVGASTDFDYRSHYSQFGTGLDLVAPSSGGAAGIYTTDRTGTDGYNTASGTAGDYTSTSASAFGGTSSACPLAAGVGALLISRNSELTAAQIRSTLRNTADKIGNVTYSSGFSTYYGYGRINANAALAATCSPPTPPTSASNNGPICAGSSATLTATGGSGNNCRWYTGSCGETLAGTGTSIDVYPASNTQYWVRWETTSCGNSTCATTTVEVTPLSTWYHDGDNDGYGDAADSIEACEAPPGYVPNSTDCDDTNAAVNPGATEVCNGIDDNCDGQIDENVKNTYYRDADGDGYGNPADTTQACSAPLGYVANDDDCDDANAAVNPGATEVCDGKDNNCDGQIDEGVKTTFYRDADGDTYGDAAVTIEACEAPLGYVPNNTDCDDTDAAVNPGATEVCNSIDDNCDGQIDEGVKTTFYRDADGDGYGDAADTIEACEAPPGYVLNSTDCDDTDAAVNPGATEVCNGIDDNCDGQIDENVKTTYYRDADSDGYGNAADSTEACSAPPGYVPNDDDCDDTNIDVNPGAAEACNDIDDDCDGLIDEGCTMYYRDADEDGYGNAADPIESIEQPPGYVGNNTDCDDTNAAVNPGATEVCNSIDDNCDGQIDEGVKTTYYHDADGDTYGDAADTIEACEAPPGYVLNSTDCDDANAAVNPGATEVCDAVDDDCDGVVDNGFPDKGAACSVGIGECANSGVMVCKADGTGTECNAIPSAPGTETCNGLDDDCDGVIDNGFDKGGVCTNGVGVCAVEGVMVCKADGTGTECNAIPSAPGTEICNGLDDDCDGQVDEGCPKVVARNVFYNNSYYDGNKAAIDPAPIAGANNDDADAIDTSKSPLMASTPPANVATFANWTGYAQGINGLIYDIQDPDPANLPVAGDFVFHDIGKDGTTLPGAVAVPNAFATYQLSTTPNVLRCIMTFPSTGGATPSGSVQNTWLQVDTGTGFGAVAERHYWGNARMESNTISGVNILVTAADEIDARNNPHTITNRALVDDWYDYNKDSLVTSADQILARNNKTSIANCLKIITK